MNSINYVIVKVDNLYENVKDGLIINDSIESVSNINRIGEVIIPTENTVLEKGDFVVIHHNIFRKKYTISGTQINSDFWLKDNLYFVPLTEIFMYKRNEDWECLEPFCFVKPIIKEDEKPVGFNITDNLYKGNYSHIGIVKYINNNLHKTVKVGDTIIFSNDSEYEFNINGELLYKMSSKDILGKIYDRT